jgi:hypothetical protein
MSTPVGLKSDATQESIEAGELAVKRILQIKHIFVVTSAQVPSIPYEIPVGAATIAQSAKRYRNLFRPV